MHPTQNYDGYLVLLPECYRNTQGKDFGYGAIFLQDTSNKIQRYIATLDLSEININHSSISIHEPPAEFKTDTSICYKRNTHGLNLLLKVIPYNQSTLQDFVERLKTINQLERPSDEGFDWQIEAPLSQASIVYDEDSRSDTHLLSRPLVKWSTEAGYVTTCSFHSAVLNKDGKRYLQNRAELEITQETFDWAKKAHVIALDSIAQQYQNRFASELFPITTIADSPIIPPKLGLALALSVVLATSSYFYTLMQESS